MKWCSICTTCMRHKLRPITKSPPQTMLKPGPPSSLSHNQGAAAHLVKSKTETLHHVTFSFFLASTVSLIAHLLSPFLEPAPLLRWKLVRWRPVVHFLLNSYLGNLIKHERHIHQKATQTTIGVYFIWLKGILEFTYSKYGGKLSRIYRPQKMHAMLSFN